jgi:hypothetical protein
MKNEVKKRAIILCIIMALIKAAYIKRGNTEVTSFNLEEFGFFSRSSIKNIIEACFAEFQPNVKEGLQCYQYDQLPNTMLYTWKDASASNTYMFISSDAVRAISIKSLITTINNTRDIAKSSSLVSSLKLDVIDKIQKNIDDTKGVIIQSIDKLISNNETLDQLLEKSDKMTEQSRLFVKTTKKMNRKCCLLL